MNFKFAIRNLGKRPFLNIIKVIGLSLSLSGLLLIALFLKYELSFESFIKNAPDIYRLTLNYKLSAHERNFARISNTEFVPRMADYFPEIKTYVRLAPVRGGIIKLKDESIIVKEAFECDSTFFRVFDTELISGNPDNVLNEPCSMVISEGFSNKIFGTVDPIGKILTIPAGQYYGMNTDYTIKGIMRDFPSNSHLHPEFVVTSSNKSVFKGWGWVYLLLSKNADPHHIKAGFGDFYASHMTNNSGETRNIPSLQKITEIHLHSDMEKEIESNSNIYVIYTLTIAAIILFITGLLNYANLNRGMAGFSDKYLLLSRVNGSSPSISVRYYLSEHFNIITASLMLAVILLFSANNIIRQYFNLELFRGNAMFIISVIILFILSCILAGSLPLAMRRGAMPEYAFGSGKETIGGRKGLSGGIMISQFAITTFLLIAVVAIYRQTNFALKSGMGNRNRDLICFRDVHSDIQSKFSLFKKELLKYSSIESVSAMFEPPGGEANDAMEFRMEGYVADPENIADKYIGIFPCDYSFASVFGLHFLGGSNFSYNNRDNEGSGEYIINEAAMKRLNYSDPVKITGKEFKLITNIPGIDIPSGKIKGVVEDFHLSGIRKKVEPLVMFKSDNLWLLNFVISFRRGMKSKALGDIENVWKKMYPEYPFRYDYVTSLYKGVYRTEILQSYLLAIFTFITVFICTAGLLGMALLSIQKRTKEIGLRKINGASTGQVMIMLNRKLIGWIVLAFILAFPVGVVAMNKWLENFAYKNDLTWWIFAFSGSVIFIISFLTVSLQSWKTASRNPVEALRYE